MQDDETFLTIGNMDLKISKDGHVMVRARQGIATIPEGFGISNDKERITLGSTTTIASTTWTGVTGLSLDKKKQTKLKKIISYFRKNRDLLKRLSEKSPIELAGFDVDFGFIKIHFKPKKKNKKSKSNNQ